MRIRIFQKGFNFSQDGPGNRLVYHLQGCNLRCPWCCNPEGLECFGGVDTPIDLILEEAQRSKLLFFEGGGVTLTGGKVTMQFDAVKELLVRLYRMGIHTCIETNGLSARLPELFPYLDLLIMDIKHYDVQIHQEVTGLPNTLTIGNIKAAVKDKQRLLLRIPLVTGFNASQTDALGFAKLFSELGIKDTARIELLTYHEYGKDKYSSLGMHYSMTVDAKDEALGNRWGMALTRCLTRRNRVWDSAHYLLCSCLLTR